LLKVLNIVNKNGEMYTSLKNKEKYYF